MNKDILNVLQQIQEVLWKKQYTWERVFTTDLMKVLQEVKWVKRVHKLPDVGNTLKPFDILLKTKSNLYWIEVKHWSDRLYPHQMVVAKKLGNNYVLLRKTKDRITFITWDEM